MATREMEVGGALCSQQDCGVSRIEMHTTPPSSPSALE